MSILTAALLITAVFAVFPPVEASAATGSISGGITIGDISVDVLNPGETWSWNAGTNTLTLDGYNGAGIDIYSSDPVTINITSSSTISSGGSGGAAVYCEGDIEITGSGVLSVAGSQYGIYSNYGNIIISGKLGNISTYDNSIQAFHFGYIKITGTVGDITSTGGGGISADSDVIMSGTVGNIDTFLQGIYANDGNVEISGAVGDINTAHSEGIMANNVEINGSIGTIKAYATGIYTRFNGANINKPVAVSGVTRAFNRAPTIGFSPYKAVWSDNVDGSGGDTGSIYVWNSSHKFVQISYPSPGTVTYDITEGADSKWTKGLSDGVIFKCDGDYSEFEQLLIEGDEVDPSDYEAAPGSTIITLKAEYLETLAPGIYTVDFIFTDGSAQTTLTILAANSPPDTGEPNKDSTLDDHYKTGDDNIFVPKTGIDSIDSQIWMWVSLAAVAAIGAVVIIVILRKNS